MKKLLILILLIGIAGTAFTQDYSNDAWNHRAGINLAYAPQFVTTDLANNTTVKQTLNMMEVGVFYDMAFLRLNAAYGFFLGGNEDGTALPDAYNKQYIDLSVLGKLPFDLGMVNIWPAVGVAYNMVTKLDTDGYTMDDFSDLNDFYLLGGVGADVALTQSLTLTPTFLFGYDLTGGYSRTITPAVSDASAYRMNIGVGLAYTF